MKPSIIHFLLTYGVTLEAKVNNPSLFTEKLPTHHLFFLNNETGLAWHREFYGFIHQSTEV